MRPLSEPARRYVIRLADLTREATQKCSAASEEWNVLNEEFNSHYRRQYPDRMVMSPRTGEWIPSDPLHYSQGKKANLPLADAEAGWSHWQREVERLAAAMNTEFTARTMLAWGTDAE